MPADWSAGDVHQKSTQMDSHVHALQCKYTAMGSRCDCCVQLLLPHIVEKARASGMDARIVILTSTAMHWCKSEGAHWDPLVPLVCTLSQYLDRDQRSLVKMQAHLQWLRSSTSQFESDELVGVATIARLTIACHNDKFHATVDDNL